MIDSRNFRSIWSIRIENSTELWQFNYNPSDIKHSYATMLLKIAKLASLLATIMLHCVHIQLVKQTLIFFRCSQLLTILHIMNRFCKNLKSTFELCVCVCVCVRGISHSCISLCFSYQLYSTPSGRNLIK